MSTYKHYSIQYFNTRENETEHFHIIRENEEEARTQLITCVPKDTKIDIVREYKVDTAKLNSNGISCMERGIFADVMYMKLMWEEGDYEYNKPNYEAKMTVPEWVGFLFVYFFTEDTSAKYPKSMVLHADRMIEDYKIQSIVSLESQPNGQVTVTYLTSLEPEEVEQEEPIKKPNRCEIVEGIYSVMDGWGFEYDLLDKIEFKNGKVELIFDKKCLAIEYVEEFEKYLDDNYLDK